MSAPTELLQFNPLMDPATVVENIRHFNVLDYNNSPEVIHEGRRCLLLKYEYSPDDWEFYTDVMPYGETTEFTNDDMAELGRPFPQGVELLVLEGRFRGPRIGASAFSLAPYEYVEIGPIGKMNYTAFVRVRPKSLLSSE